jgi:hypothetical protein
MQNKPLDIFDFDGVISTLSVVPSHDNCVIVSGRCYNESDEVYEILEKNNIKKSTGYHYPVYFNMMPIEIRGYEQDSRIISSLHKSNVIRTFVANGVKIGNIYEDDEIQYEFIKSNLKSIIASNVINLVKVDSTYIQDYLNKLNK